MPGIQVLVIIPAFNAGKTVGAAIDSVLSQSFKAWFLVLIDDHSTDDTVTVAQSKLVGVPNHALISLPANSGVANARNVGLTFAQKVDPVWVSFLDADDIWLYDKLEQSIKFASDLNINFVFTGLYCVKRVPGRLPSIRYRPVPLKVDYSFLLGNTVIATSTIMIRKSVIGDMKFKDTFYDDFEFWLRILRTGEVAYGLDTPLVFYYITKNSISSNKIRSAVEVFNALKCLQGLRGIYLYFKFFSYAFNALVKRFF